MKLNSLLLSGLFCLGLVASTATIASGSVGKFQTIEQPLVVKLILTITGLGLVVLELWWFLAKKK